MSIDTTPRPAELTAGSGTVHLPGDSGYDAARLPWNVAVEQRPAAVAEPLSVPDLVETVRSARLAGLRIAPQTTGHNARPLAQQGLDDVLVVRTGALDEVSVDAERRIARVGGGALWLPAVEAAGGHGLAALHGSSPDVGIAGYTLGGGLGWYARALGLAANSLTAVELVTADGELVRADDDENAELFWALRGGGGGFGIVTALEVRLHPIETAYAGMLIWDVTRAEEVLALWAEWAPDAPDEVTTSFRVLNLPPLPDIPEPLRGRSLAVIDGAVLGSDERGEQLLGQFRALHPEIDTFARVPAATLARLHMDPEGPTPAVGDAAVLGTFDEEAVAALVGQTGAGSGTPLLMAELRQLGGAVGRPHPGGGAVTHVPGDFLFMTVGIAPTPELGEVAQRAAHDLTAALRPWSTDRNYLNFTETRVDAATAFDEATLARLATVRATYDPDRVILANHDLG
jgi:FAD/FMN-containing dehydrogenase